MTKYRRRLKSDKATPYKNGCVFNMQCVKYMDDLTMGVKNDREASLRDSSKSLDILNALTYAEDETFYLEARAVLIDELLDIVMITMEEHLSDHQQQVLLLVQQHKYSHVAEMLGLNYTAIPNSINGITHSRRGSKKTDGGSIPKLQRILNKNPRVIEIFELLKKIKDEDEDELRETILQGAHDI